MRTCLAIVGALLLIVVAGAGFAAWRFNQSYGYTMAEPISFETRIEEDTRIQAVVDVDKLREYAVTLMPKELPQLPEWLPGDVHTLMEDFLPRELALLAGANYRDGGINLTVFANERRIGPVIVEQLRSAGVLSRFTQVQWSPDLFQLEERGVITARGKMAIAPDAEQWVLDNTGVKEGNTIGSITGENLLEILIDGHDGDFIAFIGAMVHAQGLTLEQAFSDPMAKGMIPFITNASQVYLDANITAPDEITLNLRLELVENAPSAARAPVSMAMGFGFGQLQDVLRNNYKLTLEKKKGFEPDWVDDYTYSGSFILTGFKPLIEEQIKLALGNAAATASR